MRQTKLNIAHDIGVFDVLVAVGPVQDCGVVRMVLFTGGLADVVTCGEEFEVFIWGDPEGFARKCGAVVDCAAGFGEKGWAGVVEDFVADGLFGDTVQAVGVDDIPGPIGFVAVICGAFKGCAEGSLLAEEGITIGVFWRADGGVSGHGVVLDDGVLATIDFWIDTEGEEVLVVVGGDLRRNFGAVGSRCLGGVHAVGVEHAGELDFKLVGAVEGEGVVKAVFVICGCDDLRNDEFAITG